MTVQNPPKALIVLVALICITLLLVFGSVSETAGVAMISWIVGYGVGNGIAARGGDTAQPIIGPKRPGDPDG
jgi:hypothetical protein